MLPETVGPLDLLILQPTPFCNIDCSYCYLPDRQNTKRMSPEILDQTFAWVFASGLVRGPFTLLWHAGEPLVVPPPFYDGATEALARHNRDGVEVRQSIQTNATLIDAGWCELFQRHDIEVGISVDGPAFLHDRHRKTRQGAGTLERTLRGMACLREHGVPFHLLSVLTADSLDYPDELFDFYLAQGADYVAFNPEEIEGPNKTSSLLGHQFTGKFRRFLSRFIDLANSIDPPMRVREFSDATGALSVRFAADARTQENGPFAILSVGCEGDFATYSPELLGLSSSRHGSFALGNVGRDSLADVLNSPRFLALEAEIAEGVKMCQQKCQYFGFCGGGAPGNKYFENGTFASTETLFCRLHKKVCIDIALDKLERLKAAPCS